MEERPTLADVFELAISAEKTAEAFYERLALLFSEYQEIASFWQEMARDERDHVSRLGDLRDSLGSGALSSEQNADMYRKVKSFLLFDVDDRVSRIRTLDDAYRAAVDLEFSEINKLTKLLISRHLASDSGIVDEIEALNAHCEKIENIPVLFGDVRERSFVRVGNG